MLFGKLVTGLAFAFMAIAPVASLPTAEPEVSIVEKRTVGEYMDTCHTNIQHHCDNIHTACTGNGGVIDVTLAVTIVAELNAILLLVTDLVAYITVSVLVLADLSVCVPKLILIVELLTSLLVYISTACTGGALALIVDVVLLIIVQINLCFSIVLGLCATLTLAAILNVNLKVTLQGFVTLLNACKSTWTSACSPYHH